MRKFGPIGGSKEGLVTPIRKQFGRFEKIRKKLGFMCVRRTLHDGTRIKTITIRNVANGNQTSFTDRSIEGGGPYRSRPIRIVRVLEAIGLYGLVEEFGLTMDSGWLAFDLDWLEANPDEYPLGIYVGDSELTYFTVGTAVPGGSPSVQYLIPTAIYSRPEALSPRIDWPGAPPGTYGHAGATAYDSSGFIDEQHPPSQIIIFDPVHSGGIKLRASLYTGLLRLAVQAKIGARRDPRDLLWELSLENHFSSSSGLIYHPTTFVFWKIAVEKNGAFARKLKNSERTQWIVEQLISGALGAVGSDNHTKFLAWLLADLTVDEELLELQLLTSADLIDVYENDDTGPKQPLKHGWAWQRHPKLGAQEGSVVTRWEEIYLHSTFPDVYRWRMLCTLARIDISFLANEPSMSVVIESKDTPVGFRTFQPVWAEDYDSTRRTCAFAPPPGETPAPVGEEVTVSCFYDDDGERIEAQYSYLFLTNREEINEVVVGCGFDVDGTWRHRAGGAVHLMGWAIVGGERNIDYRDTVYAELATTYRLDVLNHDPSRDVTAEGDMDHFCSCDSGECSTDYLPWDIGHSENRTKYEYGILDRNEEGRTYESLDLYRFLVIPRDDAEAFYVGRAGRYRVTGIDYWWCYEYNQYARMQGFVVMRDDADIGPTPWYTRTHPFAGAFNTPCGSSSATITPHEEKKADVSLVTSGMIQNCYELFDGTEEEFYNAWDDAYGASTLEPCENWNIETSFSFGSEAGVISPIPRTVSTGDIRQVIGGYPELDNAQLHMTDYQWTGWV